ncbi:MAG: hypothetical protein PVI39_11385 [Desulfobacteraceae bacterium]|jgi:hypothetical protein
MKITNSEIIRSGEKELIDAITGDLDWRVIERIVEDQHHLSLRDDVDYKSGDLVIFENRIAYKLDFEVRVSLSVFFDRQGNYLKLDTRGAGVVDPVEADADGDGDQNILDLRPYQTGAPQAADPGLPPAGINRGEG